MYWPLLMSGEFGGTTLTEMRKHWTLEDLMEAHDLLTWRRANEHAEYEKMRNESKGRR